MSRDQPSPLGLFGLLWKLCDPAALRAKAEEMPRVRFAPGSDLERRFGSDWMRYFCDESRDFAVIVTVDQFVNAELATCSVRATGELYRDGQQIGTTADLDFEKGN